MKFQIDEAIEILERTPQVLSNLLIGLSNSWIVCDEGEATWNAFDVIGHLVEGEKYNWIPRIETIISKGETEGHYSWFTSNEKILLNGIECDGATIFG